MNFLKRIENIQNYLIEKNLDLLIIEESISLLYLTGLNLSSAKLFIARDASCLFVDGRYIQAAKEKLKIDVELVNEKNLFDFIIKNNIRHIGFDSKKVSYYSFEKLKNFIEKVASKNDFEITLLPIYDPLRDFRLIKDSDEITALKKAASLNWQGLEHICMLLKEGVTEKQIAMEYEIFVRKNGGEKLSFPPIICFGKNSAMPHHEPTDRALKMDDIVLIDIGVCVDNYNSDMTRVVFLQHVDPKLEKIYAITKKAQNKALSLCKPGTYIKDLDAAVREVFKEEDLEKEYLHSLGHGVGLEVHEYPRIKVDGEDKDLKLQSGMVITIEPGLYIPDVGGVRYEDMILITNSGYENFYSMN